MARPQLPEHLLVARHFDTQGQLIALPVKRERRLLVLQHLAAAIPAGRELDESSVNALLRRFGADVASLRRSLVDEGFVERPAPGRYRRPEAGEDAADPDPA